MERRVIFGDLDSLQVFKHKEDAILPTRAHNSDAGLDLYSNEDIFIPLGETKVVKTGVAINVPEGRVGKIEDRSGLASKGLRTGAGVVDTAYSGEIGIVLHNFSASLERDPILFREGYRIKKGDKIAQLLLYKVETPKVVEVKNLWNSERGIKGFGSSGT